MQPVVRVALASTFFFSGMLMYAFADLKQFFWELVVDGDTDLNEDSDDDSS